MKIYKVVMIAVGLIFLQGCDSQETKVKKYLKCGLAVKQIGSPLAKKNYKKNVDALFKDSPPDISSYDMIRIGQDARDELWMNGRNRRGEAEKLINEYEESYCVDMHQVPDDDQIKLLKAML